MLRVASWASGSNVSTLGAHKAVAAAKTALWTSMPEPAARITTIDGCISVRRAVTTKTRGRGRCNRRHRFRRRRAFVLRSVWTTASEMIRRTTNQAKIGRMRDALLNRVQLLGRECRVRVQTAPNVRNPVRFHQLKNYRVLIERVRGCRCPEDADWDVQFGPCRAVPSKVRANAVLVIRRRRASNVVLAMLAFERVQNVSLARHEQAVPVGRWG